MRSIGSSAGPTMSIGSSATRIEPSGNACTADGQSRSGAASSSSDS